MKSTKHLIIALIMLISILTLIAYIHNNSPKTSKTNTEYLKQVIRQKLEDSAAQEQKRQDSVARIEEKAWKGTKASKIWAKHSNWSKDACKRIAKNEYWIGMDINMLIYERGNPDDVNTSNYGSGNEYQYCWHNEEPSCFYSKEDGIITAYN